MVGRQESHVRSDSSAKHLRQMIRTCRLIYLYQRQAILLPSVPALFVNLRNTVTAYDNLIAVDCILQSPPLEPTIWGLQSCDMFVLGYGSKRYRCWQVSGILPPMQRDLATPMFSGPVLPQRPLSPHIGNSVALPFISKERSVLICCQAVFIQPLILIKGRRINVLRMW